MNDTSTEPQPQNWPFPIFWMLQHSKIDNNQHPAGTLTKVLCALIIIPDLKLVEIFKLWSWSNHGAEEIEQCPHSNVGWMHRRWYRGDRCLAHGVHQGMRACEVQPIAVRDDCLIFSTLSNRPNCNCSRRRKAPSFHTLEWSLAFLTPSGQLASPPFTEDSPQHWSEASQKQVSDLV